MDERHYLTPLFEPRTVAIVGATEREGKLGSVLVRNMLEARFNGALYGVNPKYKQVQGVECFKRIGDTPQKVDLAVIATPAHTVPEVIADCGRAGVRMAAVLSAGFGESDAAGAQLEMETVRNARIHGLRLLGPNSLGIARPLVGLNATFAQGSVIPGSIALISQSGALCTAILDYARPNQVGFSNVVSLGVSSDLDFGEVLDYMVWDFRTESILLYVEGIRDARRFLSALRAAARAKPVMVLKVGRHPLGSRAAHTHTGAMPGDDAVFDAALRRSGVIRLYNLSQLYAATKALFAHFRPRGNRLAIITNGGGPGVMAADRAGDLGIPLAQLSNETIVLLNRALPPHWSRDNPVDLVGDSDPQRYAAALEALLADDGVDGVLCLLSPQAMAQPTLVARQVIELHRRTDKPVLTCWLGDDVCREAREEFRVAGIPTLRTPETAVELFANISSYYRNQKLLTQTAAPQEDERESLREAARMIIDNALGERRTVLLRHEAMALLAAFHVPVVSLRVAHTAVQAVDIAQRIGFPVALRPNAPLTDLRVGPSSVRLNVASAVGVHLAFEELYNELALRMPEAISSGVCLEPMVETDYTRELMIRVWRDPIFGPAIGFGERSLDPHYWPDRAVALPPLNAFLANDLVKGTRAAARMQALDGLPAADSEAVEKLLLRVSEIVCELPWVRSIELNPLFADDQGVKVVDARIEVGQIGRSAGRYDHMAIHPYPGNLVSQWRLKDGTPVVIRPIKPEDAEAQQVFVRRQSPETKYFRYMSALKELPPSLLAKLTQIDYDREMAFLAIIEKDGTEYQIGVCRYTVNPDATSCEFAIVVDDAYQHYGVGRKLMEVLIHTAQERGLQQMKGIFLANNERMLRFVQRLGFRLGSDPEDTSIKTGVLDLVHSG